MLLSVCIITYNQEKYIANAIESIIQQTTDFDFEIVIGEDFSSDKTRTICQDYLDKYPKKIRLLKSEKNLGVIPNFIRTLNECTGKYIAICEGDDYWTNPLKLKIQVDFLERNLEYSLCFHNALIKHQGIRGKDKLFCEKNICETTTIYDVIKSWYIPTASMVFRNESLKLPVWFKHIYNGDYALQLLLASEGKIRYIDEVMSIYLRQAGSLGSKMEEVVVWQHKIKLMVYFNSHTNFKYKELIDNQINIYFDQYKDILLFPKSKIKKLFSFKFWISNIHKIIKKISLVSS